MDSDSSSPASSKGSSKRSPGSYGQYGRPAAFYQQLQALNLGEVWEKVSAPVLVIYGGDDTIMSRADARAISDTVNHVHPEQARFVEIEGMDHLLTMDGKFYDALVPKILEWIKEQLAK